MFSFSVSIKTEHLRSNYQININNESNILLVVLLVITANCIARSIKYELNSKQRFNSLMQKSRTNDEGCETAYSLLQICGTTFEGGVTNVDSVMTNCDAGFGFYTQIFALDINSTIHSYRFNGTSTIVCWPFEEIEYNIDAQMSINENIFNGTGTMCNSGNTTDCVSLSFSGGYKSIHNGPCNDVVFQGEICKQ